MVRHRLMVRPFGLAKAGAMQPKSLTTDEVYAVRAFILALNKIIGENDAMNA
jgi:hypothetical protein